MVSKGLLPGWLVSIRSLTLTTILVLGLVGTLSLIISNYQFSEAVTTTVRSGVEAMIRMAVTERSLKIHQHTLELANRIQSRADYRRYAQGVAADLGQLQLLLDEPFTRGYPNSYQIDLVKLRSYDRDLKLIAQSQQASTLPEEMPLFLRKEILDHRGSDRYKAVGGYWSEGSTPLYSVVVVTGGLKISGYLEVVVEPVFTLRQIDESTPFPISIVTLDGEDLFSSSRLQQRGGPHHSPVRFEVGEKDRPPVLEIHGHEDFEKLTASMEQTKRLVMTILLCSNVVVLLLAVILLSRLIFSPLRRIGRTLHRVKEGDLEVTFVGRGVSELDQLADMLNLMLDKIRERDHQLTQHAHALEALSSTDGLTGIANRRCFDLTLEKVWRQGQREHSPVSLLILDIDYFKKYNDHYGHQRGDDCIVKIASIISEHARRPQDLAARYGGEEFVLLLGNTAMEVAAKIASSVVTTVNAACYEHNKSLITDHVTVSVGVASVVPAEGAVATHLIADADRALYYAKSEGRNRVSCCGVDGTVTTNKSEVKG
ncbi:MAG: sensor domain-containing diguanylate cyclase [Gammaproteobacteria bacterium]|nr:sensor domain-containing diguanylate cyclase [Gammaproteobacteria bacterium]